MSNLKKLKPCPFCGSYPEIWTRNECRCSNKECVLGFESEWGDVILFPQDAWNTRVEINEEAEHE